jgi:hypothetical protein
MCLLLKTNSDKDVGLGVVMHTCSASYLKASLGKSIDRFYTKTKAKKGWGHGSSAECLLSKHEALSSNPSSEKK